MTTVKKTAAFSLLLLTILFTPFFANAHVKWFTEQEPIKISLEEVISPLFIILSVLIAIFLAIVPQIVPFFANFKLTKLLDGALDGWRKYSRQILKYGTAAALMIQVTSGTIFAPEFQLHSTLQIIFIWLAIGLLLVPHHLATKLSALFLLGLFIDVMQTVGVFHMLDYGFYLAIIGVLIIGKTKFENLGFPFLYLGTGLSLCWVAVEKWVYPALSTEIIQAHQVPTFGVSPELFVILSAFIEFVVGYALVVGILNRFLSVVLTGVFIMTTMLFGFTEVIGHFMIHIVLIIFVIEGVGFYKPPIKIHKSRTDQMIFVFLNFIFVLATTVLIYYRFAA